MNGVVDAWGVASAPRARRARDTPAQPADRTVSAGRGEPGRPLQARPGGVVSPELVGRAVELELLRAAVTAPPAVVLLEGEPGIGKTRLVSELASQLAGRADRRPVLVGQCAPIHEPFPLGPVLEVAKQVLRALAPARLSPLVGALQPLLPEVADELPPAPASPGDSAAERHLVFRALAELLPAAGPAVVVLEDLHWADEHTLEYLRYVLARPPDGLSWVLTLRDEDAGPRVRELAARLPAPLGPTRLQLAPLDVDQTGRLAASIVAVDRVPAQFAADLCERTGGLPFAVEEVMALLRARGLVGPHGVVWPDAAQTPVPVAVRDHVRQRVRRLPEQTWPVLEAVAVLQRPATVPQVATMCRADADQVSGHLSRGVESGLLVEDGDAVGFRHSLARQAVYDAIPGPRRRQWHERAAALWDGEAVPPLGQLAHHLRRAGRTGQWAQVAEQAADQAAALGHDDEACRLLADVLRSAAGDQPRLADRHAGRIAVKLGRVATQTLRSTDVSAPLAEVLRRDLPPALRVEIEFLLALVYDRAAARSGEAQELFRDVARHPNTPPELRAWAHVALEMRAPDRTSYASRRRSLQQVHGLLPALTDPELEVFLLSRITMMFLGIGDPGWRGHAVAVQHRVGVEPRRSRHISAYEGLGEQASYVGHHGVARQLLPAALAGARAGEDRRLVIYNRAAMALVDCWCGDWDGLDAEVESLRHELTDDARIRCRLEVVAGTLAVARGDLARARQQLRAALSRVEPADGSDVLPAAVGPLLRLYLSQGQTDAARALTEWCLRGQAGQMVWPAMLRCLPWLVRALITGGRATDAAALIDRYATDLRGRDVPLAPAGLHQARGYLATAAGDPSAAAGHLRAATAHYACLPARYDAALAAEDAAVALLATGRRAEAAPLLGEALRTFTALGATRDAARVAGPARRLRLPVPAPHRGGQRGYGEQLSPREREVAGLAATGQTNKEIAALLFVSVDTVKKHLQAAMRKLHVRSRTALAHRLAAARTPQQPVGDGGTSTSG